MNSNRIRLHCAGSYEAGMLALADNHLDAACVDYYLAEHDGQDLICEAVQIGHNLPFILLTGLNSYEHDIAAMQAGASNYLLKGDMNPRLLERAIRLHTETFRLAHPELALHLDLDRDRQELSEPVRMTLFQVFREALNNIVKHAQACQVTIQLELGSGEALLEVRDDGRGVQMPQHWVEFARAGHLGLVGMQERAEAVGGRCCWNP